jgi:tetratricopeptide (TPR) repeat protein
LENLEKHFPDEKRIKEFRNDFDIRFSLSNNSVSTSNEKKKISFKITKPELKSFGMIAGIVLLVAFLAFGAFELIQHKVQHDKEAQINSLGNQVEALLNSSQPEKAQAILDVMKNVDPTNKLVISLSQKTDELLQINDQYLLAQKYINDNQFTKALTILQEIDAKSQDFKDVSILLEEVTNKVDSANALTEGTAAYKEGEWQAAIDNFEKVQELDPLYSDVAFREMLLNSYLHRIIQMLETSSSSMDDIVLAETYYRRAIAMVPQNKIYQAERENLQKVSRELLELKFAQTAYAMVSDPTQTLSSVNDALDYIKKSYNLDPSNTALQIEVNKMTLYQAGFQYFVEQDWTSAIQQLKALYTLDNNYANGLARQLLFESYIGRGQQNYNVGFYGDARLQFEAAEALVWNDGNMANLYVARVELAKTLGKLGLFQDGVEYFLYAVQSISYLQFSSTAPDAVAKIADAENFNAVGDYEAAFKVLADVLSSDPFQFQITVQGLQGQCISMIAAQYHSSAQMIIRANHLTQQTILESSQQLVIPVFTQ